MRVDEKPAHRPQWRGAFNDVGFSSCEETVTFHRGVRLETIPWSEFAEPQYQSVNQYLSFLQNAPVQLMGCCPFFVPSQAAIKSVTGELERNHDTR